MMTRFTIKSLGFITSCITFILSANPPKNIPENLHGKFTLSGKVPVTEYYFDNSYLSDSPLIYEYESVEELKKKASRKEEYYYGPTDTYLYEALNMYSSQIKGKIVGIIGSVTPWYESIVLSYGGMPITIDYNKIISRHPDLITMTIEEYDQKPITFDVLLSISSIEHDGLGRYGDPINPNGDLETMEKVRKMLKPDGIFIIAIPVGKDWIFWNAHRVYGPLRLPMLFNGWKVKNTFGLRTNDLKCYSNGWHQPVYVLELQK